MHRWLCCVVIFVAIPAAQAYSVLTHEAVIDSAWDQIKPVLLKQFPQATPDELTEAHAFAYGGCIIQDMGYYPFGSKFFSDLVHYVRSGDFVINLLRDAQSLDEYAFAVGALAHYAGDEQGHSVAVNPSVALLYPKLRDEYGKSITYEDNPTAHLKVEFGFDVLQVARGRYAPQSYHDFIGFKVSKPVLERAFHDTYSLELRDVFGDLDLALGTYRFTVSRIIPEMTKVAWNEKKKELMSAEAGLTRRKFVYNLSRASFRKEWDGKYEQPGIGARILAVVLRILPKIGPLRAAAFKPPTAATAKLFEDSFDRSLAEYRSLLSAVGRQNLALQNRNFDTGEPTRPGQYKMADRAYAKLLVKLAQKDPAGVDPKVTANLLGYFKNPDQAYSATDDPKDWTEVANALAKLQEQPVRPVAPSAPEAVLPAK